MLARFCALLVLHLLAPAIAGEECVGDAECAEEDTTNLLQLKTGSSANLAAKTQATPRHGEGDSEEVNAVDRDPGHGGDLSGEAWLTELPGFEQRPLQPSQTSFMVKKGKVTDEYLGWWNFPVQQDLKTLDTLKADLTPVSWFPRYEVRTGIDRSWIDMRSGLAKDIIPLMHQATNNPEVVSKVPDKLRGVFWMQGNEVPEELAVLQHGVWYEDEGVFHTTAQPFNWAWPAGRPSHPPSALYTRSRMAGMEAASMMVAHALGFSVAFEECGPSMEYCIKNSGKKDDMAFGYMEANEFSNLMNATNAGTALAKQWWGIGRSFESVFTMQDMSGDGTHWKRTCHWGFGDSGFIEKGSYDLVKVMDGDGKPVQPHYDNFVNYMGDVPLLVWTGWASSTVKQEVAKRHAELMGTGTYPGFAGTDTVPDLK